MFRGHPLAVSHPQKGRPQTLPLGSPGLHTESPHFKDYLIKKILNYLINFFKLFN